MSGWRDWGWPAWLLVALAVAVGFALVAGASTGAAAYGTFNPAWDGGSELRATIADTGTEPYVLLERAEYDALDPDATAVVVLSPSERYTVFDQARLARYVENGGTLVVAEDFRPHANPLLRAVGAEARVTGQPLRDNYRNTRTPAFPQAQTVTDDSTGEEATTADATNATTTTTTTDATNTTLTRGVDTLALNHPSTVEPNGATVLVRSSRFGYLDRNRNGTLDADERLGRYPVVTTESVGAGRVVVVSDPSLFVNAMQASADNRRFVENVAATHDRVGIDYTHTTGRPPLAVALVRLRRDPLLQAGVGAATLAVVLVVNRQVDTVTDRIGRNRVLDRDGGDEGVTGAAETETDPTTAQRVQTALLRARVGTGGAESDTDRADTDSDSAQQAETRR